MSSADPLELSPPGLTFDELDRLRSYLERTLEYVPASMRHYYDPGSGGFRHKIDPEQPPTTGKYSKASTATCLSLLDVTGLLEPRITDKGTTEREPWVAKKTDLRRMIVFDDDWSSAGLEQDNPFTVSFMLEAVFTLSNGGTALEDDEREAVDAKLEILLGEVMSHTKGDENDIAGSIHIPPHAPTAFLTQAAVRVLKKWGSLPDDARAAVESWTWTNLQEESVLIASDSADSDVFELAYSVLTASAIAPLDAMTPQQRGLIGYALDQFFACQNTDGGWPRSRPLFLYPEIGYAYCFDYELLVQMLSDRQLMPIVFSKLRKLDTTAMHLDRQKYPLGSDAYGWSSGHHGRSRLAESWSTASVFHFCFLLQKYVAEAIRRDVFKYAGGSYSTLTDPPTTRADLGSGFLDSQVKTGTKSLKRVIEKSFLQKLIDARSYVEQGRPFPRRVPVSAIFYGAPGTSKTELAKLIAQSLGWPFLALDPSHLTRQGLDQVHAEAHRLFGMLQSCEQIVVLLDEFDELVREREEEGRIESRFLTTAMLPKLAALSNRRRIVYLIATNHIERFDIAIRRPGRFDLILPVMPPTASAKLAHWAALRELYERLNASDHSHAVEIRRMIGDLTYLECESLVRRLEDVDDHTEFATIVEQESKGATMSLPVKPQTRQGGKEETWRDRLTAEVDRIRIPEV